jgi:hypothetical protein
MELPKSYLIPINFSIILWNYSFAIELSKNKCENDLMGIFIFCVINQYFEISMNMVD